MCMFRQLIVHLRPTLKAKSLLLTTNFCCNRCCHTLICVHSRNYMQYIIIQTTQWQIGSTPIVLDWLCIGNCSRRRFAIRARSQRSEQRGVKVLMCEHWTVSNPVPCKRCPNVLQRMCCASMVTSHTLCISACMLQRRPRFCSALPDRLPQETKSE